MKRLLCLVCALAALCASRASAQRRTTQGFETDCRGAPLDAEALDGITDLPANVFAACGIASIVSGQGGARIARDGLLTNVPNVTGRHALVGGLNTLIATSVTLTFAPAVNDMSLQVLGISANTNLRIQTFNASGAQISSETAPAPSGGRIVWFRSAASAVTRLTLSYVPSGAYANWFIDQLSFNAWVCGDGELENTNGGSEACDDGNQTQCDGCSTTCAVSVVGCFDGTTCVSAGKVSGCASCDMTKPAGPNGNVPVTRAAPGSACDDAQRCTQNDVCDAAGRCAGSLRSCDDGLACTSDVCSESAAGDGCTHAVAAHACLIGTSCVAELTPNPANPCQLCDPARANSAWSPQPATLRCGSPTCVGSQFTPAAQCDGAGSCPPAAPTSCGEFACANAASCTDHCSDDRECSPSSHCDPITMKCIDNQAVGTPCSSSSQCGGSQACVDGVCCESSCGDRCETCNAPGSAGRCVPITEGDPDHECPAGSTCRSGNQCASGSEPPGGSGVLPLGAACDRNEACGVGFCKDGVCCDSACDGPCQGCNVLGSTPGQCTAYSLGTDPEDECADVRGVCGGDKKCTFYETRGNGLCSPLPGQPGDAKYALSLVGLLLAWGWHRRRVNARLRL
jgi:hypothetical protein